MAAVKTKRTRTTKATAKTRRTRATARRPASTPITPPTPRTLPTRATATATAIPLAEGLPPGIPTSEPPSLIDGATGDRVVEIAKEHIGEDYVFGARAPLNNADWTGPWDCAEFASWCVYQASAIVFGAEPKHDLMKANPFTGYWGQDAEAADQRHGGVIVSVETGARIPGALVLRKPGSFGRRVGHIVISDGLGGTVEAMSTNRGVVQASLSNRSWDYGVLVPGVQYFVSENPVSVPPPEQLLKLSNPMMRGPMVEAVQRALASKGFNPEASTASSVRKPRTQCRGSRLSRAWLPTGKWVTRP